MIEVGCLATPSGLPVGKHRSRALEPLQDSGRLAFQHWSGLLRYLAVSGCHVVYLYLFQPAWVLF